MKCSSEVVSGSVGPMLNSCETLASRSARTIAPGMPAWSSSVSRTCSSVGSSSRTGAIFLRYRALLVTTARASPIAMRCRTGSGPKALKSGAKILRALKVPRMAAYSGGTRPIRLNTVWPGSMSRRASPLANWLELRARSA